MSYIVGRPLRPNATDGSHQQKADGNPTRGAYDEAWCGTSRKKHGGRSKEVLDHLSNFAWQRTKKGAAEIVQPAHQSDSSDYGQSEHQPSRTREPVTTPPPPRAPTLDIFALCGFAIEQTKATDLIDTTH
jgi:hypothetical protein